jgi:hypothetical protein
MAGVAEWVARQGISIEMRVCLNPKYPFCILIFQQINCKQKNKAQQIYWAS